MPEALSFAESRRQKSTPMLSIFKRNVSSVISVTWLLQKKALSKIM
jgi:hypothetical protein